MDVIIKKFSPSPISVAEGMKLAVANAIFWLDCCHDFGVTTEEIVNGSARRDYRSDDVLDYCKLEKALLRQMSTELSRRLYDDTPEIIHLFSKLTFLIWENVKQFFSRKGK